MRRIELVTDPAFDAAYPAVWAARVTVELADGTGAAAQVDAPKGDPENAVTWDEAVAKFRDLAVGTAFEGEAARLVEAVVELDDRPSVRGFLPAS